jgi:hypothetical protein
MMLIQNDEKLMLGIVLLMIIAFIWAGILTMGG